MTLSSASPPHAHACAAADAAASHGVYIAASPDRAPRGYRAAERAHGPCQLLACPRRSPRRAAAARRAPRGGHGAMSTFGADLPDAATKGGTHLLQRQARAQVRKTSRRPQRNPGFVFLFWLFLFNPKWTTQSFWSNAMHALDESIAPLQSGLRHSAESEGALNSRRKPWHMPRSGLSGQARTCRSCFLYGMPSRQAAIECRHNGSVTRARAH